LRAVAGDAGPHHLACIAVVDKYVRALVGIVFDQVVGTGDKGDVAPIGRDLRDKTVVVG
jgi:hypothetical protein